MKQKIPSPKKKQPFGIGCFFFLRDTPGKRARPLFQPANNFHKTFSNLSHFRKKNSQNSRFRAEYGQAAPAQCTKNFPHFFLFCEHFLLQIVYYNNRNPPNTLYIVFCYTPYETKNTFSKRKGSRSELAAFSRVLNYSPFFIFAMISGSSPRCSALA